MEIEEIESSDDLIVREYNELVRLYKKQEREIVNLNDEIKAHQNELNRLNKLKEDFENEVEKRVKLKHAALLSQVVQLKKNAEKHIQDKKDLKKEIEYLKGKVERIEGISEKFQKLCNTFEEQYRKIILDLSNECKNFLERIANNPNIEISGLEVLAFIIMNLSLEYKSKEPFRTILDAWETKKTEIYNENNTLE